MPLSAETRQSIITLVKFTAIGMLLAYFVIVVFSASDNTSSRSVELKEVSPDIQSELSSQQDRPLTVSYASAVTAAAPAVVNIYTSKKHPAQASPFLDDPLFKHFFGDQLPSQPQQRPDTSLGSGVIVSTDGYILTNNHVIEKAQEIEVALRDGRAGIAKVIGTDPESDLAVLKVEMDDLPSITLGHSKQLQIGDVVLAIGNPFGVGQTVTMGIISATGRDKIGLNTFEDFIQTDAAINPGNSGGALINAYGHLVGINTAIFSRSGGSQGIGFAIPVDIVKLVLEQILKHGHMVRGWLGIEIQNLTRELAESFGINTTQGVIIAGVLSKGPADKAGLKPGDIITAINGKQFEDGKQALKLISSAAPGTEIELTILRRGKEMSIDATTAQRPVPKGR